MTQPSEQSNQCGKDEMGKYGEMGQGNEDEVIEEKLVIYKKKERRTVFTANSWLCSFTVRF